MQWNLTDLYSSPQDPQIQKDIDTAADLIKTFRETYHNKLATLSSADLCECIQKGEKIDELIAKPSLYLGLKFEEDSTNDIVNIQKQKVEEQITHLMNELLFFPIEYGNLSQEQQNTFEQAPQLAVYRNYLHNLAAFAKYHLSEAEERVITQKNLTGANAFEKLYEHITSKMEFPIILYGKKQTLTESEILDLTRHPDREIRKKASKVFTKGLKKVEPNLLYIYNTLMLDRQIEVKLRNIPTLDYTRHLANEISPSIVSSLTSAVQKHYHLVTQYYAIKAKLLDIHPLYEYDRYAPMQTMERTLSFEEGKDIVLNTFKEFSPKFYEIALQFFDKQWIDAFPKKGKRSGAFCATGTPKLHPYVLLNYMGKQTDVLTMAHELGHGIHDCLSSTLPISVFAPPLVTAEMASVFAENIVFEKLLAIETDKNTQIALLTHHIEDTIATVFRQTAMYQFELDAHTARQSTGELTKKHIQDLWRKNQEEMFGDSVILTKDYDIWWSYITHFFESPFYVYAYAFGNLLVFSLIALYKKEGQAFINKYLTVLSSGDSLPPQELLRTVNVDIADEHFWDQGLQIIAEKIHQLEELL